MAAEVAEAASSAQEFGGGCWIGQKKEILEIFFQARQKGERQRWQSFRGLLLTKRARWVGLNVCGSEDFVETRWRRRGRSWRLSWPGGREVWG